jgi:CubicO group peptidase (beta-lactamase class C family)
MLIACLIIPQAGSLSPRLTNAKASIPSKVHLPAPKEQVIKNLNEYMDRIATLGFSGVLLVAMDDEIIFSRGYGMADRSRNIPFTTETVTTTGSITKQFTGAAILILEMMGKLSVQDPITKYLVNVPSDKKDISLHHLLTHTAGLRPALGYDFAEISREEYIELAMSTPLNRASGELYEYSNVGFRLLAAIVEQVSGQSYDAFVHEHLFKPAGMTKTGYAVPNWHRGEMAHGYRGDRDWGTFLDHPRAEDGPYWHLRGNGGILTTVGDMFRWHKALEGDAILSEEAKKKYYYPHVPEGPRASSHYGYGWSIVTTPRGTKLITHNGGNPYFAADFLRYVDEDVVIFIASNTAEQRATRHSRQIARIVFGYEYTLPPLIVETISETELQEDPLGRSALAFLEILGTQDEESTSRFIREHYASSYLNSAPMDRHLMSLKPDQAEIGAAELGQAVRASGHVIELTVQSKKNGEWWLIKLIFEKEPPHGISGIGMTDSGPPAATQSNKAETKASGKKDWGLPDSATGRRATEFLNVVYLGDEALMRSFVEKGMTKEFASQFPIEEHLSLFEQLHDDLGEIELLGAEKTGPFSAEILLGSKSGGKRIRVQFELEPESPNRISMMSVEPER